LSEFTWLAAVDAVFDRGPGSNHHVVLVRAHHAGPLALQHADHLQDHAANADLLADRRFVLEQFAGRRLAHDAHAREIPHIAIRKDFALLQCGPIADHEVVGRGPQDFPGLPITVAVNDLHAAIDAGSNPLDGTALAANRLAIAGRQR
jgi:hypothetical protein